MAQHGVEAVKVSDAPDARRPRGWGASSSYRELAVSQPTEPWVRPRGRGRVENGVTYSVRARFDDDGRWEFERMCSRSDVFDEGIPGPVGKVWDETAPRARDRFTHDHLRLACERLGLFPFDADFYAPDGWGVLTEYIDPKRLGDPGLTLAQARGEEPGDR